MRLRISTIAVLALAVVGVALQPSEAGESRRRSEKPKQRQIVPATFDKTAEQVKLFDGMEEGQFEARVIPHGPQGGFVVVENTTDLPLTVQMPEAFVAVPTAVLKQFGQQGGFGGAGAGGQVNTQAVSSPQAMTLVMKILDALRKLGLF